MDNDLRYGVVMFDDDKDPGAGWAAVSDADPRRIQAKRITTWNELATDVIWWTNIQYEAFYRGRTVQPWRVPTLRHDKYLPIGQADALREWGYDPTAVEADFVCQFCAQVFDRIMRIAWHVLADVNPKMQMRDAFQGKTLREDLRPLLPELEYPQSEAAVQMKSGQAWEEFTATSMNRPKGSRLFTLRRPRMSYAMAMLQTPMPRGPFEFMSRGDMRSKTKDRVSYVKTLDAPAMVEVTVNSIQQDVAPVYGFGAAISQDKRKPRSWVAAPEFNVLETIADLDVRSIWQGGTYWAMVPDMNEAVQQFLSNKFTGYSWSAGIVAESLWRTVSLAEDKQKNGFQAGEERAATSWQGLWVRAADKTHMFQVSMRLAELGYSVASYGLGWTRCAIPDEEVGNLIRDGLTMGLVPLLSDVPDNSFPDGQFSWPKEDNKARTLARFTVMKNHQLLWNLDKTPSLPVNERGDYINKLAERMKKTS